VRKPRHARPRLACAVALLALTSACGSDTPERRWLEPVLVREPARQPSLAANSRGDIRAAWAGAGGIESSALVSGQWSTPEEVSSGNHTWSPQIAISNSGDAFAVWQELTPFPYGWLKVARRASESGWEPPVTLNGGRLSGFVLPELRVFDDGGALVVWIEDAAFLARHFDPQSGWSSPILLGDSAAAAGQNPVLWTDTAGRGFVLWHSSSGWSARHLEAHGAWGAEEHLPDAGSRFETPSVAVRSGGEIDVVWERYESGSSPFVSTSVWANRFVPGSGWTPAVALAADARTLCGSTVDTSGQLAVWGCRVDPLTEAWGTWYAGRSADGSWAAGRQLTSLPSDAAWRMLTSHGGTLLGLWSRGFYTSPGGLWAARLTPGGEWEAPQVVVQSGSVVDPIDLRMLSPNDGVVAWVEGAFGSDSQRIRSAQFADGQWRPAQDVSGVANLSGIPYPFHMVVRPSGDAVALWSQSTSDSGASVWSNTSVRR
jgi:hypothetical protein